MTNEEIAWVEGQSYLLADPSWKVDAWQDVSSLKKNFDPVWLYFDGEIHLCRWDADGTKGYRWECCEGNGYYNEDSIQLWKPVVFPAPPAPEYLAQLSKAL